MAFMAVGVLLIILLPAVSQDVGIGVGGSQITRLPLRRPELIAHCDSQYRAEK